MTIESITKKIEEIENSLQSFHAQAKTEIENTGRISTETKNAIDRFGEQQREIAERLLAVEQRGGGVENTHKDTSWGYQFTNSDQYKNMISGSASKARFEVQNNTLTGSDATVSPDRKSYIVPGAFQPLTLESFLPKAPTNSNAIEYTRELAFTNNAAETAEGAGKQESSLTWELVNMPVSTVPHYIRISKQMAADAPALAAYVNNRMVYGVNQKVEMQLAVGTGVAPQLSGLFKTGNFTAHGIANAALGTVLKKIVLIRKVIADLWTAGYPADAILMNPSDWATIETDLLTTAAGQTLVSVDSQGNSRLWGYPVIQAIGVAAGNFQVGAYRQAATIHERQGVMVELSESDADNFTKNLITIRAERRLALCVEIPAAIRGGSLTPA